MKARMSSAECDTLHLIIAVSISRAPTLKKDRRMKKASKLTLDDVHHVRRHPPPPKQALSLRLRSSEASTDASVGISLPPLSQSIVVISRIDDTPDEPESNKNTFAPATGGDLILDKLCNVCVQVCYRVHQR